MFWLTFSGDSRSAESLQVSSFRYNQEPSAKFEQRLEHGERLRNAPSFQSGRCMSGGRGVVWLATACQPLGPFT